MRRACKLRDMYEVQAEWETVKAENPDMALDSLIYVDDEGNDVTVIDDEMVWAHLTENYMNFYYNDPQAYICAKLNAAYIDTVMIVNFSREWSLYLATHPEFSRIAKMMDRTDYDPLENYDRKEDGGWHDTTDDDAVHSMAYAEVSTTTENDPKIKTKTTGKVYPDDGGTAMNDTESITEPVRDSATDVDTITTTTPEHTDTSSVEGDLVVTREFDDYHVHGNIGVTTAAQMIEGEIKVREKYNLITRVLDGFAKKVLTLRKEVIYYDD